MFRSFRKVFSLFLGCNKFLYTSDQMDKHLLFPPDLQAMTVVIFFGAHWVFPISPTCPATIDEPT